jgi:hypothetical protein
MKPSSINSGIIAALCATSLAIGIGSPGMTVTPPAKATPTKTIPTIRATPLPKVTPAKPVTPVNTPIPNPPAVKSNIIPLVAVPTLTPTTLKSFTNLYGEVLAVKFTPNQQQKIQQRLSREWMTNLGLRNTVTKTMAMEPQILRGTPAERSQIQTTLVGNLRQQVLDGDKDALWWVSFYDASSKNWLAPGKPPLTQMTTDISAEALCFMVNEVMGKSVATNDSRLKNAIATKLTAEYTNIPVNIKQELARLPINWLTFRENEWARRGDEFREQMRIHWGQNLEAYIPELKAISKLRRDRLAMLKADPTIQWSRMNSIQRQGALQKSELDFQNNLRTLAQVKTVQVSNYVNAMEVASSIGNSPTRYPLRLKVK